MKRLVALALVTLALGTGAFGGDVATLVNLGFSPDSAYFMFGFYGLDPSSGKPYAKIFLVDTKKNDFTSDGEFEAAYPAGLEPGQDAAGAFYKLFSTAVSAASRRKIDHLAQGRLIYLSLNGDDSDTLSFKDYATKDQWDVVLREVVDTAADGSVVSSFGLDVSVKKASGASVSMKAGNPQIRRKNVSDYAIRWIVLAPDGKTVVVLVERTEKLGSGTGLRYMVETFQLP
ncbi:MAG: DUF2259 domain-containing protein [Spirochaetales bacterium]|nr:DUF2259 domain-containing protein [Spirochaetales bacterium]